MEARLTLRRLLSLAALAAAVATTSACGGGSDAQAAAKDPPSVKYADKYLSFSHPAAWTASAPTGPGELHYFPVVYLSTQPVGHACSVHGNTTTCDWPLKQLKPGGVLAIWQFPYTGPMNFAPQGKRTMVGGDPAWIVNKPGGECQRVGADRTVDVMVNIGPQSNFMRFTACLRGPGVKQAEKSIDALLASAKFVSQ